MINFDQSPPSPARSTDRGLDWQAWASLETIGSAYGDHSDEALDVFKTRFSETAKAGAGFWYAIQLDHLHLELWVCSNSQVVLHYDNGPTQS